MNKKIVSSVLIILLMIFTLNTNSYAVTVPELYISSNNYSILDKLTFDEKNQIEIGENLQLYSLIIYGNEQMVDEDPESLGWFVRETNLEGITWSSSNTSVAKVDNAGKVTGISEGTATISAHYEQENQDAEYEIKVVKSSSGAISTKMFSDTLQKLVQKINDNNNDINIEISFEDNYIKISSNEYMSDFILDYDLSDNPTFTYTADIQKGMSYDDYTEKTDMLSLPLLGYLTIANIQGAEYDDALSYIIEYLIYSAFSNMSSIDTSNSYMILEDGVTYTGDDNNVIKKSEFGNRVMEYVDSMYKEKMNLNDSDALNSFEWITEKQDVSDDSCKLISTLTVNLDADFTKLAEYSSNYDYPSPSPSPSPSYSNGYSQEEQNKQLIESNTPYASLPKAGLNYIILISSISLIFIAIVIRFKLSKYKDIK